MHIDKYQAVVDGISLMELGDTHSRYTPSEVNTYLLLPIQYNRIRLYYQDTKPVGLITWCWLSPSKSTLFLEDKYEPVGDDYALENPEGYDLWAIEFIAPFGHTRRVVKAIRKEHKELYGTTTSVHFRRFYDRNTLHKRTI